MDGSELLKLIPKAVGFFSVGDDVGVITSDNKGWLFEGGVPHPIGRSEMKARGGVDITADDAAELFDPGVLDFLQDGESVKKNAFLNSIEKINRETSRGVSPTTAGENVPAKKD